MIVHVKSGTGSSVVPSVPVFEPKIQRMDDRLGRVSSPKKEDGPDTHPELHNGVPGLVGTGITIIMVIVITKLIANICCHTLSMQIVLHNPPQKVVKKHYYFLQ